MSKDPYNDGVTRADIEVARRRGREARAAGKSHDDNPYPYDNVEYRQWERAYDAEAKGEGE